MNTPDATLAISAAICTYNRADLLGAAIESLLHQDLPPDRYEILVIDNASTDATAQVVKDWQARAGAGHTLRYLYEGQPGLGVARNTALRAARGEQVAYLDDDAKAAPDWLSRAVTHHHNRPDLLCAGGLVRPFYTTPPPAWFKDEYEAHSWGTQPRLLADGESFSGPNMIWNRAGLLAIGGFNEQVGVKGEVLSLGEETYAFRQAWRLAPSGSPPVFWYDPDMVVYHWAPPFKLHLGYAIRRAFANGQAEAVMALQTDPRPQRRIQLAVRSFGAAGLRSLRAISRLPGRLAARHPWQQWVFEDVRPVVAKLGLVLAAIGGLFEIRAPR